MYAIYAVSNGDRSLVKACSTLRQCVNALLDDVLPSSRWEGCDIFVSHCGDERSADNFLYFHTRAALCA